MDEAVTSVSFEAYEHTHAEKGADWFWVLGIITLALTVAAVLLNNVLLAVLVLVTGVVIGIAATRPLRLIPYAITTRGIRIEDVIYPYSTLEAFFIDEENHNGPQLLVRSKKLFMPLLVVPLPEEYVDDIEELVAARLPEEHMEEPLAHKLLEFFGF